MTWRDRMFHEDGIPYLTCSHWGLFEDVTVRRIEAYRDAWPVIADLVLRREIPTWIIGNPSSLNG